ncbi:MAG: magnesium transporter NIPA-domain-containing protein [Olpidium bornovanus]|uniref:Magnesium transporter NIPA-domain-containing protein n=1 Tax=Olpidium bornovanus TaxID=278681 RepID=A0A8H8DFG4_9FUNG|nr:MAG: magnesium transporter NIPA-domain-containing protein [Olpidium bornovanus]
MMRYIGICSLTGSLSIVATQGVGPAVVLSISDPQRTQINHWFFWFVLAFMAATLVTELVYLNRALGKFNAAIVTPVYYVTFTTATIASTSIFARGYDAPAASVATGLLGFFVICSGVYLLQVSKREQDSRAALAETDQAAVTLSASELRANPLKMIQDVVSEISLRPETLDAAAAAAAAAAAREAEADGSTRRLFPSPFRRQGSRRGGGTAGRCHPGPPEQVRPALSSAPLAEGPPDELAVGPDGAAHLSLTEFGRTIRLKRAVNLRTAEHANIIIAPPREVVAPHPPPPPPAEDRNEARRRSSSSEEDDLDIDVHLLPH